MPPPAGKTGTKAIGFGQTHELAGIELLRFLSAVAILLWHYQHFFFTGAWNNSQAQTFRSAEPVYWLFGPGYEYGSNAVEVFWVISGFIFYWRYAEQVFDHKVGFVEFVVRRFSRLYPLHVATLMLVAVLQFFYLKSHGDYFIYENNTAKVFLGHLILLWYKTAAGFNGPIWSIFVEVITYLVFFWTVRTIGPAPRIAFIASGFGLLLYLSGFSFFIFDSSVFECVFLFFAGGLIYWLSKWLLKQSWILAVFACIGAPTIALFALHIIHIFSAIDIAFSTVVVTALGSVLAFVCLGELTIKSILKRFAFLGNATYSSYLMHFPIQLGMVIAVDAMGYSRDVFFSPVILAAYLGLVIAASLTVYHLFEFPAQRWIRRYTFRMQRSPAIV